LHLVWEIMSYVSSPLWLMLLVVSIVEMMSFKAPPAESYIGLEPIVPLAVSARGGTGGPGGGDPCGALTAPQIARGACRAGESANHARPWRRRSGAMERAVGVGIRDPDGADRDAAA
jgi:hypothetical protein